MCPFAASSLITKIAGRQKEIPRKQIIIVSQEDIKSGVNNTMLKSIVQYNRLRIRLVVKQLWNGIQSFFSNSYRYIWKFQMKLHWFITDINSCCVAFSQCIAFRFSFVTSA